MTDWQCHRQVIISYCKEYLIESNRVSLITTDAEYCTIRSEAAVRIPANVEPIDYAPLLCAGVTVFNGIRKMGITAGDVVGIQGLGGLGHLAVQFSRKMGYRTVALSSSDAKRQFAKDLGANEYVDGSKEDTGEALQKMGGASLIVMTAPNPKLVQSLQNGLGVNGKLLILSRTLSLYLKSICSLVEVNSMLQLLVECRSCFVPSLYIFAPEVLFYKGNRR